MAEAALPVRAAAPRHRRARTETVLQLEAAECGPAALAMVLSHFGRRVSLEELRIACGVSRDGSKASSLLKAARAYGLEGKGLKAEPEHLGALPTPMIAFVNFNHFLVVEGIKGQRVWLNDPAFGPRQVSMEEFDLMFTGVVLTFRAGESFKRGDSRQPRAGAMRARLRGAEPAVLFVFLASLALVIPGVLVPVFSRVFVDQILVRSLQDWLVPLLLGMGLTALLRAALSALQVRALLRARTRLAIDGARATLWRLLRLPTLFFSQRFAGELADRLDLNDGVAALLTGELAQAVLGLITATFFLFVMLAYDPTLAGVAVLLAAGNLALLASVSRRLADGYRRYSLDQGKLRSAAIAGLQDIESFKAAGAEDAFFRRWAGLHAEVVNTAQRLARYETLLDSTPALLHGLATAAVLTIGGAKVMSGDITIGTLVAFQTLMASFVAPVASLASFGAQIQQARAWLARLDDIHHQPVDVRFRDETPPSSDAVPRGAIRLSDVRFGYAPFEPPVVSGFDLDVRPGARVALVGASGSGKSTIGRIIAGLLQPDAGSYSIDGRSFEHWSADVIAARLAHVDQHIVLFEGTVRDNLNLWDVTIDERDLVRAARDAGIHEVIAARPGAYDARIEESGRNFSGGQRQRLDIARALARNPSIIVLDEATSALDPVSELHVMEAIRRRGATCVIVAHRLSTIRDCDEIIVLERGRIVERGTHDELVSARGRYYMLIEG